MANTDSTEVKLTFLQVAQKNCELFGIGLNRKRLNANVLIMSAMVWLPCLSSAIFVCREANTFREYTESILGTSIAITISSCYTIIIIRMDVLFNLINCAERIANTSKREFDTKSKCEYFKIDRMCL